MKGSRWLLLVLGGVLVSLLLRRRRQHPGVPAPRPAAAEPTPQLHEPSPADHEHRTPVLSDGGSRPGRFTKAYGAPPVHLVLLVLSFCLTAYVVYLVLPARGVDRIAIWFAAAVVAHDLVVFPLYALADRVLTGVLGPRSRSDRPRTMWAANHVRLPSMASALLLLVFAPAIFGAGEATYTHKSGLTEGSTYLDRWLWLTVAFFLLSALLFVVARVRGRRSLAR